MQQAWRSAWFLQSTAKQRMVDMSFSSISLLLSKLATDICSCSLR